MTNPTLGSNSAQAPLPMSQEALEAMPFPFTIYTHDGLYVAANDLVEQLFRVPKAAVIGRFNFLTDPVSEGNGTRALFQAAVAGQRGEAPPTYYDFSFPGTHSPDRPGCWIANTFLPFRNATGQVTHVGMLIQDVSERVESEQKTLRLTAMIENAVDAMGTIDLQGRITYCNAAYLALTGYGVELLGQPITTIFVDDGDVVSSAVNQATTQGHWQGQLMARRADGRSFPAEVSAFPLRDHVGQMIGVAAIIRDLTEERAREDERAALQEQVIAAQQAALRELSTPLIPIAEGVVAMPLIGSIDSSRAQAVVETLLTGTAELRAHTTIIDITGVPVVDTQVANALLRAAQAVKLLGAKVILTGIRPEVAQTLVGLGVDLGGIITRGTLQSGIAEALERGSKTI